MNLKNTIVMGAATMALFVSFGCGGNGNPNASSPAQIVNVQQKKNIDEAIIKSLIKKLESSDIADKKEACPMEKLPGYAMLKTPLMDIQEKSRVAFFNHTVKSSNLSVSEIKQEEDFASARISFTTADNKLNTEILQFTRIDGKWCIDALRLKSVKHLKVSGDDAQLEAAANLGYTYENEPIIVLDVRSKTTAVYQAGGWSVPSYILITEQGEFPLQNTAQVSMNPEWVYRITSAQTSRFTLPFKGATGTPKALRITGFNELNSEGFAVGHDKNQVVTFTLSE